MQTTRPLAAASAWRLQDAKAQFSALVDNALRGLPQHITRRGKPAVVVLSEQDFEALQRSAFGRADKSASFIEHLLSIPKAPIGQLADSPRLHVKPRDVDFT